MFFIHETGCISPQLTFSEESILKKPAGDLTQPADNKFLALEPAYEQIPSGILRRMGRAVRLGVGAGMSVLTNSKATVDGVVIGTSMGGMEDCVKFLSQIIEYNEGKLTPTNFVQSTPNAIAGQLGLLRANKGYNITHVHRGFSFENAVVDVDMLLKENPGRNYLLGAVDEIAGCNYNVERLDGWYKTEPVTIENLYTSASDGSIAGEGSSMFIVNTDGVGAVGKLSSIHLFHSRNEEVVKQQILKFINEHFPNGEKPDLLLTGENGDQRFSKFYAGCEQIIGNDVTVARFKHLSGEQPSVSGFGLWISTKILKEQLLPDHMIKSQGLKKAYQKIIMYNNYKGIQHSLMLIESP